MRGLWTIGVAVYLAGCGLGGASHRLTATGALTSTAEWLEFEAPTVRAELFREVAVRSAQQQGRPGAVLFPMLVNGQFVGAPAITAELDLLGSTGDAGAPVVLTFQRAQPFSEDRRDAFQGLSEREAAEQIARSLLGMWNVRPAGPVTVVRAAQAPYAAAYMDGELRLNPAFVYMAAAPVGPFSP